MAITRILDIGSGERPYPRATVLADLVIDNHLRRLELVRPARKPFVQCDIHNLPFPDKTFDRIYCTHVLAEVDNPVRACEELIRVAHSGYIESPSWIWELMFGRPHHKWMVLIQEGVIYFVPNNHRCVHFDGFFDKLYARDEAFREMFMNHYLTWTTSLLWEDTFEFKIKDGPIHPALPFIPGIIPGEGES